MVSIQESSQKLREAESVVAQLKGELRALDAQEKAYAAKLTELGLTVDQVPAALDALKVEQDRLNEEVAKLTAALAGALE